MLEDADEFLTCAPSNIYISIFILLTNLLEDSYTYSSVMHNLCSTLGTLLTLPDNILSHFLLYSHIQQTVYPATSPLVKIQSSSNLLVGGRHYCLCSVNVVLLARSDWTQAHEERVVVEGGEDEG